MRKITYSEYLDKIYACFLGKAISGNIGAPHEGVKMPLDLPFVPQMINPDMPNDDLDLQVLWLDVLERKGYDFTSADLLERFVASCDYAPGEYAVMRKNFQRGILPPYSGKFCNDYYIEGMGAPIRSELWGCVAIGNPSLAAELATRDAQQDHFGESVNAERFLAVLECNAFFESDIKKLILDALNIVPEDSKFRKLVIQIIKDCEKYNNPKKVFSNILFNFGHPDCTNMYQNMGIIIMSLLLGEMDVIKATMMALNCGFDTDCTCATVGAILGIIQGSKILQEAYKVDNPTYVLGVRSNRRSNLIKDLAEDISLMGVEFSNTANDMVDITDAPAVNFSFEKKPEITFNAEYCDLPSISLGGRCSVDLVINNNSDKAQSFNGKVCAPNGIICEISDFLLDVPAKSSGTVKLEFSLPYDAEYVYDTNIIKILLKNKDGEEFSTGFGISGATPYKLSGPYWRTDPICTTQDVLDNFELEHPYMALVNADASKPNPIGNVTDVMRQFHLNFAVDTETDYANKTLFDAPEIERIASIPQDSFKMDDLFGLKGPCAAYLSRIITMDEERSVFIQVGHSSPFKLFLNDKLLAKKDTCDNWTAENVHVYPVTLKKGDNRLVLRMARTNSDAKYNVTFTIGDTLEPHIVDLKSKNPLKW